MHKSGKLSFCFCICILILMGCNPNAGEVSIEGDVIALADSRIYLQEFFGDSIQNYDSIKISKRGFFKFYTDINSPKILIAKTKNQDQLFSLLIYPKEKIQIKSALPDLSDLTIYGSRGSILLNQLNIKLNDAKEKLDSLSTLYRYYKNDVKFDSIKIELEKSSKYIFTRHKYFSENIISSNVYSPISILALFQKYDSMHPVFNQDSDYKYYDLVDTALLALYPDLPLVKSFHKKVETIKAIRDLKEKRSFLKRKGDIFPDIPFKLNTGDEFRISGHWFRLLLINFNSPNCDKCLKIEDLKKIHRDYNKKGLIVLNIDINYSDDDYAPVYDTLGFYNVLVNSYSNNKLLDTLNISSLPANFITDRWSTIRADNLDIKGLQHKLKEMLP